MLLKILVLIRYSLYFRNSFRYVHIFKNYFYILICIFTLYFKDTFCIFLLRILFFDFFRNTLIIFVLCTLTYTLRTIKYMFPLPFLCCTQNIMFKCNAIFVLYFVLFCFLSRIYCISYRTYFFIFKCIYVSISSNI